MKLISQFILICIIVCFASCSNSSDKTEQNIESPSSLEDEELRKQAIQDSIVNAVIAADQELQEKIEKVETAE